MIKVKSLIARYSVPIVLLIAAFLRLWNLGSNPPHLTPDEAALGYNAYSLLKTGRDEYGKVLPIIFKSFGDFKPGLYIYAAVPFVALLGLTEYAVRLPSAIAGVVSVWLIYKVTLLLFAGEASLLANDDKKKSRLSLVDSKLLALLALAVLALSPWHIHFSRGAWEVNLALTLTLSGIYFFLRALEKPGFIIHASIFFSLTLITYQGAKLSALIVVLLLIIVYWKEVRDWSKNNRVRTIIARSLVMGLIITTPVLLSFFQGKTGRLKVFSVFSYRRPEEYLTEQLQLAKVEFGSPKYYLYYSESLNIARGIMGRWLNHYSGRFLFFEGDWQNPRHSSPDHGQLLFADMIFLVVGIGALMKHKNKRGVKFIIAWLLFAPLPSVLSRDQVHAVRALNMVIPFTLVSAFGVLQVIEQIKKIQKPLLLTAYYLVLLAIYSASMVYFLDSYFVHLPVHDSKYWEYGYKQVVKMVAPIQNQYHTVHVRQSFAQPYIYFLFYGGSGSSPYQNIPYDPAKYQAQANLIESEYGDVGRVEELDNIRFWPIDWQRNRGDFGTLFVADPIRIPPEDSNDPREFRVIDEIKYLDGKETAFRIIEVLDKNKRQWVNI